MLDRIIAQDAGDPQRRIAGQFTQPIKGYTTLPASDCQLLGNLGRTGASQFKIRQWTELDRHTPLHGANQLLMLSQTFLQDRLALQ